MRRILRYVLRATAVLVVALIAIAIVTPMGRYIARAGWAEAGILLARRPIPELVRDGALDAGTRGKLSLVVEARAFAVDSLGLDAGESFTTFSQLERDTLVLVLSAAKRDELALHRWWFPIVGRVPYKGYFDFDAARRVAADMRERGYDTYLRPASAFSTLGWFNDPLVSTTLRLDSAALANTVIHELTHNTFYAPGQAIFNESFANFVGARGAERFFRARGDSALVRRVVADWEDDKVLGRFYTELYDALDSAFAAHGESEADRLRERGRIYAEARARLVREIAPRLTTVPAGVLERVQLDNAALLARRIYVTDLELFDAVYEREGKDLERARERIIALAKSRPEEPFEAVREWLAAGGGLSAPAGNHDDGVSTDTAETADRSDRSQ